MTSVTQDCSKCQRGEDCKYIAGYMMCHYKEEMFPKWQSKSRDKCRVYKERIEVEVKKKGRK
jgi:hypothetical protein